MLTRPTRLEDHNYSVCVQGMTPTKDEKKAEKSEKRPNQKRRQYDDATLEAAFEDVIERGMSIRAAAGKHGIPEATVRHKLSGKRALESKPGPKPLLSMSEEQLLVANIMNAQKSSFPVTKDSVMTAVKCILEEEAAKGIERKRPPSFTGDKPGQKWWTLFRKRHPDLNFYPAETADYSELSIPYTHLEHSPAFCQGAVDPEGFKEASVQTQPPPHTTQASQTDSISNLTTKHDRLKRPKYDRSLCDMVLEYAGYAPLLHMYLSKPFTAAGASRDPTETHSNRHSGTPDPASPRRRPQCSEGENDQPTDRGEEAARFSREEEGGRFSGEEGARVSGEDKPTAEDGARDLRGHTTTYSVEEDGGKCTKEEEEEEEEEEAHP